MNRNKATQKYYYGSGWYVDHVWFVDDQGNQTAVPEAIYICGDKVSREVAAVIARERGFYGDPLQLIDLEAGNE